VKELIPFNKPCVTGYEIDAIQHVLKNDKLSGNGVYGEKCTQWLESNLPAKKALLAPSCTAALEMSALLMDLTDKDEVIMPSYTFVTTYNNYALRGAFIKFVDIELKTINIDSEEIKKAITSCTKGIVVFYDAGVACDMDQIM